MSDPPPILSYATPEPRVPVYLVVILYLWAVLDMLWGVVLVPLGGDLLAKGIGYPGQWLIGLFLLALGVGLFLWGLMTFKLASQMRQHQVAALRQAASLTIVAEVFAWALPCVVFVMIMALTLFSWKDALAQSLFFACFAAAVSVTRMMLRRAVKRMPAWQHN